MFCAFDCRARSKEWVDNRKKRRKKKKLFPWAPKFKKNKNISIHAICHFRDLKFPLLKAVNTTSASHLKLSLLVDKINITPLEGANNKCKYCDLSLSNRGQTSFNSTRLNALLFCVCVFQFYAMTSDRTQWTSWWQWVSLQCWSANHPVGTLNPQSRGGKTVPT